MQGSRKVLERIYENRVNEARITRELLSTVLNPLELKMFIFIFLESIHLIVFFISRFLHFAFKQAAVSVSA